MIRLRHLPASGPICGLRSSTTSARQPPAAHCLPAQVPGSGLIALSLFVDCQPGLARSGVHRLLSRLSPFPEPPAVLEINEACQRFSGAANPAAWRITSTARSMPASELIIKS